jgi:hypothetical protein
MELSEQYRIRPGNLRRPLVASLLDLAEQATGCKEHLLFVYEQDITKALRSLELSIANSHGITNEKETDDAKHDEREVPVAG